MRRPMAAGRCFYYCGRMVGIAVDVEGFIIGLSVWIVGSVRAELVEGTTNYGPRGLG